MAAGRRSDRSGPAGWQRLLGQTSTFARTGEFPVPAYSEFMPGPYVGIKPYGRLGTGVLDAGDEEFPISEYEQAFELGPGLEYAGTHIVKEMVRLAQGTHGLVHSFLENNPYWPDELRDRAPYLTHETYTALHPVALSRTQDDKGRITWTLFGASELGPARAFWESFWLGLERERPAAECRRLLAGLVSRIHPSTANENVEQMLRILPLLPDPDFPSWSSERIPSCLKPLIHQGGALKGVRYLLTFNPFSRLPAPVRSAYLAGRLHLLPSPSNLVIYGHQGYRQLGRQFPAAMQLPLLHAFPGRHAAPHGLRILQSGWIMEPSPHRAMPAKSQGAIVSHVKRSHRWSRTLRDEDELESAPLADKVADALFSTEAVHLGLYGKPMARNSQIWTHHYALLLNGPEAPAYRLHDAKGAVVGGGHFGYRFYFPPMQVGRFAFLWHKPVVASLGPAGEPVVDRFGFSGFLEGRIPGQPDVHPVALWPGLLDREDHQDSIRLFGHEPGHRRHTTTYNIRKVLEAQQLLGQQLPESFLRRLLTIPRHQTYGGWIESLSERAPAPADARRLAARLAQVAQVAQVEQPVAEPALTFATTATRSFEERYFSIIAHLATGQFVHKNNADLSGPAVPPDAHRDLEALGDYLHAEYHRLFAEHGMEHLADVGDHFFRWRTDFDYPWSAGWERNQTGAAHERNIVVRIPGRDRTQAVIMGDHYDTAYMEDVYDGKVGPSARAAAAGADDNHSATAALLMAARTLLPLSREGRLAHDVWLVHLTGEEFPTDCLGARALVQRLVERNFAIFTQKKGWLDLSHVRIRGAYILDMVAHNNDHERYIFQISPGDGPDAHRLALAAHRSNEAWNRCVPEWNVQPERRSALAYRRSTTGLPQLAPVAELTGEIRPSWHFASSLYNTDGQIFSDAGIPVVLLMEHYDINRKGYHDTHDTLENIDLDYGAALVAIAIETIAQLASTGRYPI